MMHFTFASKSQSATWFKKVQMIKNNIWIKSNIRLAKGSNKKINNIRLTKGSN